MIPKSFPPGLGQRLLCLLLPQRCILCGKPVGPGDIFCDGCAADLPEGPCRRELLLPDGRPLSVAAPLAYQDRFRKAVHRYKFQGRKALALPFGWLMAGAVQVLPGPFDGVAYVPLSKRGLRARGYDQSRLLAQRAGKALGLPVVRALEKRRDTAVQHDLNRKERARNVKGAYVCTADVEGRSLLLVDDIVTTGNTLLECAGVLYGAGARHVSGLCAAEAVHEKGKTKRAERDAAYAR